MGKCNTFLSAYAMYSHLQLHSPIILCLLISGQKGTFPKEFCVYVIQRKIAFENVMAKGKNAGNQLFLHFPLFSTL